MQVFFFIPGLNDRLYHEAKRQQVSRTLLSILVDLSNGLNGLDSSSNF